MYEYGSRVRFTEVDQNRKMTLTAILNAFQDCSTFHSEDLGVGVEYLEKRHRMWVLRSWKIVVYRYPKLAERIRVGTWACGFGKLTGQRNFRLLDEKGELAACADTEWVFMDTVRNRPAMIDDELCRVYEPEPGLFGEEDTGKIVMPESLTDEEPFAVRAGHLDVNRHVNNGQYVQLAAAYLPEGFVTRQMRAEYRKPAVLHDRICPQVGRCGDGYTILLGDGKGKFYAVVEFSSKCCQK